MLVDAEVVLPKETRNVSVNRQKRVMVPYLYLIPGLAGVLVWVYRPLYETVRYSFYNWNLVPSQPQIFVGWSNYKQVLEFPALWQALGTTGLYIAAMLVFSVAVPIAIGVASDLVSKRAHIVFRAAMILPVIVSPIVAAAIWNFLLAPNGGLVDDVLGWFGIEHLDWLTQAWPSRLAIMLISGWKVLGLSTLIVMAGLAAISPEYHEAAEIDGATWWQRTRQVTLPLLSPTVVLLVIVAVLFSSQVLFPLINSLTQGGPAGASTDIYYLLYTSGFSSFDVGLASAAAVLFFIVFGIVAMFLVRLLDRFSHFDN